MREREIKKARQALSHAGTIEDKEYLRSVLKHRLVDDAERLRESKNTIRAEFRRTLERWRTERVPEAVPVRAIPNDVHASRLNRATAIFALACEMGLAAWIFHHLGVHCLFGLASALCITFTLHGVFVHIFEDPERPKRTLHLIRCVVSVPAICGFLVALALVVLARYVSGDLALALLPLFSLALWLGTLSLLFLAASLFTLAHIRDWSRRYENAYRKIEDEERGSLAFLKELEREETGKPPISPEPLATAARAPDGKSVDGRGAIVLAITLLMVALASNTACGNSRLADSPPAINAVPSANPASAAEPGAGLHIYIDWSGSCVRSALEEGWTNLRTQLPALIDAAKVRSVSLWRFDQDGWSPERIVDVSLPAFLAPPTAKRAAGEWQAFANFQEAVTAAENRQRQDWEAKQRPLYREALRKALQAIDDARALPPKDRESARTDVVGLLRRLAVSACDQPQFFILLTDLADTRYRELPKIPAPRSELHALLLLVPAKPKDVLLTTGKNLSGSEQFEFRRRSIHESAPWINVEPYFERTLSPLLSPTQE